MTADDEYQKLTREVANMLLKHTPNIAGPAAIAALAMCIVAQTKDDAHAIHFTTSAVYEDLLNSVRFFLDEKRKKGAGNILQ